ncbi:MAG: DNA-binding protein [Crocinitomicaceae bacterium]|nr:DNA-binding protein [Crocinitomicaceae bacterium]|tara:strand:- start:949 stop:1395 length:447 start_codon:yes stop_codon:yes gene_type:complete
MAKSQQTFNKKEKEKKKLKKREEKARKRLERKENNSKGAGLDSMIAYVDEYGAPTDEAPDPANRVEVDASTIELGHKRATGDAPSVKKGKVTFFDDSKGYGFIKERNTGTDYFVHVNGCLQEIGEGDNVTFDLERGLKGMNAVNVRKI